MAMETAGSKRPAGIAPGAGELAPPGVLIGPANSRFKI